MSTETRDVSIEILYYLDIQATLFLKILVSNLRSQISHLN